MYLVRFLKNKNISISIEIRRYISCKWIVTEVDKSRKKIQAYFLKLWVDHLDVLIILKNNTEMIRIGYSRRRKKRIENYCFSP